MVYDSWLAIVNIISNKNPIPKVNIKNLQLTTDSSQFIVANRQLTVNRCQCRVTTDNFDRGHVTSDMWQVIDDMWQVTCNRCQVIFDRWLVTGDMWHLTQDTCHVTGDMWYLVLSPRTLPKMSAQACVKEVCITRCVTQFKFVVNKLFSHWNALPPELIIVQGSNLKDSNAIFQVVIK